MAKTDTSTWISQYRTKQKVQLHILQIIPLISHANTYTHLFSVNPTAVLRLIL